MEKSKVVKTDQPAENMIERLPQEILGILSSLPIISLVQSKLVYRAWRSLIQDPLLVSQHLSHMANNDPSFILQSYWPASKKPAVSSSILMSLVGSCKACYACVIREAYTFATLLPGFP